MNPIVNIFPIKQRNACFYWPLLGLVSFAVGEYLLFSYGEKHFWYLEIFVVLINSTLPLLFIYFENTFRKTMLSLSEFIIVENVDFTTWLDQKERNVFSFETFRSKAITIMVTVLATGTILFMGMPMEHMVSNIIGFLALVFLAFFGGYGANFFLAQLIFLNELVKLPIRVLFFRMPRTVLQLQSYYSLSALVMTIIYSGLVLAAWLSPYQLAPGLLLWLGILGLYPLVTFCWSMIKVHSLMRRIKQSHLDTAYEQLHLVFAQVTDEKNLDAIPYVVDAMDIKTKVQAMPEWPINVSGVATIFLTAASAVVQITVSVINIVSP